MKSHENPAVYTIYLYFIFQMWSVYEESPWNIQSLYDLQYFNCPSCDYKDYSKQEFVDHAYNSHPEAYPYLNKINDGSIDDVIIPNDETTLDFKSELDAGLSSPYNGLDVKIEEFEDNEIHQHVKSEDKKFVFDNSYESLNDFKTEVVDENDHEFYCDHCNLTFDDAQSKKQHILSNHRDKLDHKCEHCNDAFFTKRELISHYNIKHKDMKLFSCNDCQESFGTSKQLISHTRSSNNECGSKNELLFAIKNGKKLKKKQCDICNSWVNPHYIQEHLAKHKELEESCQCDQCNEQFQDRLSFRVHNEKVHGGKAFRKKQCEICNEYVFSKQFKAHLKKHEEGEICHCELCSEEFPDVLLLKVHIRNVHGDKKREKVDSRNRPKIKCEKCDKYFRDSFYPKHVANRHQEGPFICEQCAKEFSTKYKLKAHANSVHGNNSYKACTICGKMLSRAAMKGHISAVHEKNKDWVCMTCGKAFSEKRSLAMHEQFHSGIRQYECTACGVKFITKQCLRTHKDTVHERKTLCPCPQCGKLINNKSKLKRHIETVHEGIKRFKCHLCSAAYGQSHELKKHLVGIHKEIIPKNQNIHDIQKSESEKR